MSWFSWLTPPQPAAIAVVRLATTAVLDRNVPASGRACFARVRDPAGAVVDEVIALGLDDGVLELHCHGGPGVRAAVTAALVAHGLMERAPVLDARWTALASAPSPAAALWLLRYADTTPPFAPDFLRRPPLILITGAANAGKSTLLNAWCGHRRAIVSALPGTTRDLLAAETRISGWRVRLLDSAGLRATGDALEAAGQALVAQARARVDLVLHLRTDAEPITDGDLIVTGKADLLPCWPEGLAWSDRASDDRTPEALLAALGAAVLARLRLPVLPST